jgi:hypothetical protein
MSEHRDCVRTPFRSKIKITHESIGTIETVTRDISNKGVFLLMDDVKVPPIGSIVKGQVLDLPGGNAPILDMEVVRESPNGIGLRFVLND